MKLDMMEKTVLKNILYKAINHKELDPFLLDKACKLFNKVSKDLKKTEVNE